MSNTIKNQHGEFATKAKNGRPKFTKSGVKIDNVTGVAKTGRPTVMTKHTIDKLEAAFCMGCTDHEACLYANINPATLYLYQKSNPDFIDRKEFLKETIILHARDSVSKGVKSDYKFALDFLARKRKDEFSLRTETTGKDGEAIEIKQTINSFKIEIVDADK